jgi:hypothetical protein
MKRVLFFSDYNGMAGVISTLIADYVFDSIAKEIGCFSLALIAPLSTK